MIQNSQGRKTDSRERIADLDFLHELSILNLARMTQFLIRFFPGRAWAPAQSLSLLEDEAIFINHDYDPHFQMD